MRHLFKSKPLIKGFSILCVLLTTLQASASTPLAEDSEAWQKAQQLVKQGAFEWDQRVLHGTLPNGMNYTFFDARQDSETAAATTLQIQLIVHAGATDEDKDQLGVAHMVEHMSFRGTEHYPDGVRSALQDIGLIQGRNFNAMTNADVTRYMLTLPSSELTTTKQALFILKEMMFESHLSAADWHTEQPIILEEWRSGLSASKNINEQKKAVIRVGSPYPERPVIGTQESILTTPIERIKDFHNSWYAPNNMSLVMVGAMDPTMAKQLIEDTFATVPQQTLPSRKSKDPELDNTLHIDTLSDPESRLNRIAYLFRFAKIEGQNLESRRQQLISYLAKKLLSQQVRRQSDAMPNMSFNAVKGEASPNVDIIAFGTLYTPGEMALHLKTLLTEIERIRYHGFHQSDFDEMLAQAKKTAKQNIQAADSRGVFWLAKINNAVTNRKPLPDPRLHNELAIALLETIEFDDVNQMVKQWLTAKDRVAYLQKAGDNHYPETLTATLLEYTVNTIAAEKLAPPLTLQPIAEKSLTVETNRLPAKPLKHNPDTGVSAWQLANGERMWLVESPNAGDQIRFEAIQDFGYLNTLFDSTHSQILAQMMANQAPLGWSKAEEEQWKKRFHVAGSWDQSEHHRTFEVTTNNAHLAAQLGYFQQQALPHELSKEVYDEFMRTLQRRSNSDVTRVSEQFSLQFSLHQYGKQADTATGIKADLEAFLANDRATLSKQAAQLNQRPATYFITAKNVERLRPILSQYLGAIPRVLAPESIAAPIPTPLLKQSEFVTAMAREPRATYKLEGFTPLAWNPNYTIMIPHLADEMNAQFKQVLRGEKQGIYSLRSDIRYDMAKQGVLVSVRFTAAPERIEELNQTTRTLLSTWLKTLGEDWVAEQKPYFEEAQAKRDTLFNTQLNRLKLSLEQFGDDRYLKQSKTLAEGFNSENLASLRDQLTWPSLTVGILLPTDQK